MIFLCCGCGSDSLAVRKVVYDIVWECSAVCSGNHGRKSARHGQICTTFVGFEISFLSLDFAYVASHELVLAFLASWGCL